MSGLYRVRGVVTAADGTSYRPEYWGDETSAYSVFYAVCEGARDRGDGFEVTYSGPAGLVASWSGPVRDPDRSPFEVLA